MISILNILIFWKEGDLLRKKFLFVIFCFYRIRFEDGLLDGLELGIKVRVIFLYIVFEFKYFFVKDMIIYCSEIDIWY